MANAIGAAAPLPDIDPSLAARPPAADPADGVRIGAAVEQLRATESGREVADFLAGSGAQVRVVPDADFAARYHGAGAVYDPKTRIISMPSRALASPALVTTLAHEGKHALDYSDRPHWALQSAGLIGGSAKDGAKALVTFRNPVTAWLDSLTARRNEDEVTAYHVQAKVAHELGRNESSWALGQASDGTPLPIEEIRANVATDDLYRMKPIDRLALGAAIGVGATSVVALGAQQIGKRVLPGSYLGAHSWPMYALGGAVTAAWLIGDQVRSHRLESYASHTLKP